MTIAAERALSGPAGRALSKAAAWRIAYWTVLLAGVAVRLAYVDRPFDHRLVNPWRQSDYYAIARNFDREGMNILYPRIDWRADQPGYAEMELPFVPWVGALLYRIAGPHVELLRGLSAALAIAALVLFARLARRLLSAGGALLALIAVACNPLVAVLSGALQPEPLLDLCTVLAVLLLHRWTARPTPARLYAVALAAAAAMLAKMPAAYLGVLIAYATIARLGTPALRRPAVYLAAVLAVVPPLAWYVWAHHFWTVYGLSLGVSNESHVIGWDALMPPRFLLGIVRWELLGVFSPVGWLLALAALSQPWRRIELPVVWYAAVMIFYVLAGRTTGDRWAFYYHTLSVAPAALLMGAGFAALFDRAVLPSGSGRWRGWQRPAAYLLAASTVIGFVAVAADLIDLRDRRSTDLAAMRECVLEFAKLVPPDRRIVVRGGAATDELGHPVAHNESMAFAWMDRKGFNYADDVLGIAALESLARRGARYWIARRDEVDRLGGSVDGRYRRLADCARGYALYDLRPNGPR